MKTLLQAKFNKTTPQHRAPGRLAASSRSAPQPFPMVYPKQTPVSPAETGLASPVPTDEGRDSSGHPLPEFIRLKMENAFGVDISSVRIHTARQAEDMDALAYASGDHLHFAPGRYSLTNPDGQELIGHELAHVVQQRGGRMHPRVENGVALVNDPDLESEADRLGERAVRSQAQGIWLPGPQPADNHLHSAASTRGPGQASPGTVEQPSAPIQLNGRKKKGFSLGQSHSTNRGDKVTSHSPAKGRTENPRKSAALNRKRQRQIQTMVLNSQKKK
jgi:hypothetical protein